MSTAPVFEATEANFAAEVVDASRRVPILVDFHASWCEPCKVLGPLLERMAEDSGGAFRVAKVDSEREGRLAAMFQVQSIPYVVAFLGGRPADAFVGALGEVEIRAFLDRLGVRLGAPAGEPGGPADEPATDTPLGKATVLLRGRRLDEIDRIRDLLDAVEADDADFARARRLSDAMPWIAGDLAPAGAAAEAARAAHDRWAAGDEEAAMRELFASVEADPEWRDGLGRKALVALMQLHDDRRDLVDSLRRRLALLLY